VGSSAVDIHHPKIGKTKPFFKPEYFCERQAHVGLSWPCSMVRPLGSNKFRVVEVEPIVFADSTPESLSRLRTSTASSASTRMQIRIVVGIQRKEKNLMRKFVAVTTMLLIVSAAPNARAADGMKLYQALLNKQPERMPEGFSSATLDSINLKAASQQAGMVGIAKITFAGKNSSGEVRYAVFSTKQDIESYARDLSMPGRPIFFPYFPKADCTSHGNRQACEIEDGTVMIIAITRDLAQGIHGTTAGILGKAALDHLRSVRQAIGQAPPPE